MIEDLLHTIGITAFDAEQGAKPILPEIRSVRRSLVLSGSKMSHGLSNG